MLEEAARSEFSDRLKPELMQCVLESGTVVCDDIDEAEADLRAIRGYAAECARAGGMRLGAAATHPFSLFENQKITARDRYRQLVEMLQYIARRELVFGMHVHVAVPSPELRLQVMEGVLIELPVLLALSSNSPFWRGEATGLASTRALIFATFPRSGLPPRFDSYDEYADAVGFMEATGAIGDYTHLWWDVRPHPRLGTIELRVMDVQTRIEDTVALAAYVQCLVKQLLDQIKAGHPPRRYSRMLLAENKWLASRYGLDAPLMDLAQGRRVKMPARTLARRRLRELKPIARELGCSAAAGPDRVHPRHRHRRDAPAPGLERQPRHRRGRARDRRRHRGDLSGRTEIETERLVLRRFVPEDIDGSRPCWAIRTRWSTGTGRSPGRSPFAGSTPTWSGTRLTGYGLWVVEHDGEPVGDCGIVLREVEGEPEVEVGYHLARRHWGNGYATEAAAASIERARELGIDRVIALILPANVRSQGVAQQGRSDARPRGHARRTSARRLGPFADPGVGGLAGPARR